ncbi:hypothetical protein QLX08_004802 [Tetragonisca angustula]|uniref:Uncharacterized protein n=1 Tax=Tetragonisca angustula TaxID=166442 RepID=A0AAW1A2S7_9HYME
MESETSTSSYSSDSDDNDTVVYIEKTVPSKKLIEPKELLRLILLDNLSVIVIHMNIEEDKVVIQSKHLTKFFKLSHREYESFQLINRSVNAPGSTETQEEILIPLLKRFALHLKTDFYSVSQTVENIFSSLCEIALDFNLRKLMQVSQKRDCEIKDIITEMFWRPMPENKLGNEWFDWVDRGYVIPLYMTSASELDNVLKDYSCDQTIERSSRKLIMWYFLGINISIGEDTYSLYQTEKNNKPRSITKVLMMKDITVLCDYTTKFHGIYVLRHSADSEYKVNDNDMINLLKNPFLPTKRPFPFIVKNYNLLTSKYSFYIIYPNSVKITNENFYSTLTMLRNILLKMQIKRVVLERSDSLSLRRIFKMLKFIFRDQDITVIIGCEKC